MKLYFPGHMNKLGMIWDALVSLSNINLSITSIALFPPSEFPPLLPLSFLSSPLPSWLSPLHSISSLPSSLSSLSSLRPSQWLCCVLGLSST